MSNDTIRRAPAGAKRTDFSIKCSAIAEVLNDAGLPIIAQMVRDDADYARKFMRAFEIVDAERARAGKEG